MQPQGLWGYWHYALDTLSIVSNNHLVFRSGLFRLEAELDLGVMLHVDGGDHAVVAQVELGLGIALSFLQAGMSFRAVMNSALSDGFQGSFAPIDLRGLLRAGFVDLRFNLNLDPPFGWSFDDDGFWGLELGGGLTF